VGGVGFIFLYYLFKAIHDASKEQSAAANAAKRRVPQHGYAILCPLCGLAMMREARVLHVVRGRGLFTSHDTRTVAGCSRCVRLHGALGIARDLFNGLPSLGGLIAAPLYTVANISRLMDHADPATVEWCIRQAGLDPDEVRLDADRLVRAERRRLEIACFVASRMVWAEGHRAAKGFERALTHVFLLVEGKVPRPRIGELMFELRSATPSWTLSKEERAMLLHYMRDLALADGPFTAKMSAAIRVVTDALGFTQSDVGELFYQINEAVCGRRGAEEAKRNSSAGAGAGARAGQENTQEDPRAGRQRRAAEDIEKARILLGVTPTATYGEIERAYRVIIAACHPDRAGLDARLQKVFTQKSQQITWAKEVLRRSYQASS
jgi:hypothetical protein